MLVVKDNTLQQQTNEPELSMRYCEDNSEQFGLANYVAITYLWNDISVNPSTRGNLAHV